MIAFDNMTSSQFAALSSAQFDPLPSKAPIMLDHIASQMFQPQVQAQEVIEWKTT